MRSAPMLLAPVLVGLWPCLAAADGLVYQLPPDGVWARFAMQGVVLDSEEKDIDPVLNITGTLTLASVGAVQVGEEVCRWIEIVIDGQRDGKAFKEVDKLLIPEKHIATGTEPLKHLRDAWYMHSAIDNGKPRRVDSAQQMDLAYVHRIRAILHPPFQNASKGEKVVVECKLGKVECETVTAEEHEKQDGSDIEYRSSYTVYLHTAAPFGVAAWQAVNRVYRGGALVGATRLNMTLADHGEGAQSSISIEQ